MTKLTKEEVASLEEELILKSWDEEIFSKLIMHHKEQLISYIIDKLKEIPHTSDIHQLAEDIAQDTISDVYQKKQFGKIEKDSSGMKQKKKSFFSYLKEIARFKILDHNKNQ